MPSKSAAAIRLKRLLNPKTTLARSELSDNIYLHYGNYEKHEILERCISICCSLLSIRYSYIYKLRKDEDIRVG